MSLPGVTGSGESVFVTERSAEPVPTVVVATPLSLAAFESVGDAAVAVFVMIVPSATLPSTLTTSVKTALPGNSDAFEQEIVPVPPTAGVVHDQPAGDASDTNVVFAGSVSFIVAVSAVLGPALL